MRKRLERRPGSEMRFEPERVQFFDTKIRILVLNYKGEYFDEKEESMVSRGDLSCDEPREQEEKYIRGCGGLCAFSGYGSGCAGDVWLHGACDLSDDESFSH